MNIAFIPARGGSKSIPLKNIKHLCGKPLVYWSINALENSKSIDKIYLATDSEEIINSVKEFKFTKLEIYFRDDENAQDHSSTESVMLEFLNKKKFQNEDLFILVQATSPFTKSSDFDNAIKKLESENGDSLLSGVVNKRFYWNSNGTPVNYDYNERPRRQDFPGYFMENGAFYINTVENILKNKNRLSGNIVLYEMPEYTGFEIDEPDDWIICESLMKKYNLDKNNDRKIKIKLFLTDVDGVLTDAGMYYSENGDELKKFCTYDGKGIELLKKAGIITGIITGENTKIVENRARKIKINHLYQGIDDKVKIAEKICEEENISFEEIAYIGDDLNDYDLLNKVGVKACPDNAQDKIKSIPGIIKLNKKGGDGAVREFAEILLKNYI